MFSLRYNRRLFWIALAAALWMCCGMLLALGAARRPGEWPPVKFSVGLPEGGLWLPGMLQRIEEQPDRLLLTLAVPPGAKRELRGPHGEPGPKLPADLELHFVDADPRQAGPPEVILLEGPRPPRELPGGRQIVITSRYIVKFGRGGVRVIPRPADMTREKLKRWLEKDEEMLRRRRQQDGQPGGPPNGPGQGLPPGEEPGPPPGMGQGHPQGPGRIVPPGLGAEGPGQGPPPSEGQGPPPGAGPGYPPPGSPGQEQGPPPGQRGRGKSFWRWLWQKREAREPDADKPPR